MDANLIYTEIQKLPMMAGALRNKDVAAVSFLQDLYLKVTGKTVYAGCKNCHIKAANYLMTLTLNDIETMSNQKFKLDKHVSIQWPYKSGQYLLADTINDAKAAEYLYNNPKGIQFFSEYPKNDAGELDLNEWYPSEEVAEKPVKKGKKEAENVIEVPEITVVYPEITD